MLPFPLYFSRRRIERSQCAPKRLCLIIRKIGGAIVRVSRFVRLRRRRKNVALLARRHIKEFRLRIVRRRHPVRRSRRSRTHAIPFWRGHRILVRHRPPRRVLRRAPGNLGVACRRNQFPVCAIQHVEKPVAIRLRDQFAVPIVNHHRDLRRIVIMFIVLRELEMPFQFPCISIERHERVRV